MAEQERLIVGGEGSQQYAVRDFEAPVAAVNLQERNVRLQNIIPLLEEKKKKEHYVAVLKRDHRMDVAERDSRLTNTARGIESVTAQIHDEFAYACGSYALLEAGVEAPEVRRLERRAFSDFLIQAIGPSTLDKARDTRAKLRHNYEYIASTEPFDIPESETSSEEPKTKEQLRGVREDMLRILSDDRAGFYVFSNQEKNRVLPWLDYLEKPDEYPRGVWHQLEEVFRHQQKYGYGIKGGYDAVRSIVYETIDYYQNAKTSAKNMEELQEQIEELPHYRYTVAEEFGDDDPAYAALTRFMDISRFVQSNELTKTEALRPKLTRFNDETLDKHKKVEDQYTAELRGAEYTAKIQKVVRETKVVDARSILKDALESEYDRVAFYEMRLRDIATQAPESRVLQQARNIAQDALTA